MKLIETWQSCPRISTKQPSATNFEIGLWIIISSLDLHNSIFRAGGRGLSRGNWNFMRENENEGEKFSYPFYVWKFRIKLRLPPSPCGRNSSIARELEFHKGEWEWRGKIFVWIRKFRIKANIWTLHSVIHYKDWQRIILKKINLVTNLG